VIRRFLSVVLFVLGGWLLTSELVAAFIDAEPGIGDNLLMIAVFAVLTAPLLLLGVWASPGRRWQEFGLTVLIAAGVAFGCGLVIFLFVNDPTAAKLMPQPMPRIDLAPVFGTINLLLVAAFGWWMYRGGRDANSGIQ
jgi:hypothetical protein